MLIEGVNLESVNEDFDEIVTKYVKVFNTNLVIDSRIKTIADKRYDGSIISTMSDVCDKAEESLNEIEHNVPEVVLYIEETFDNIIDELFSEVSENE